MLDFCKNGCFSPQVYGILISSDSDPPLIHHSVNWLLCCSPIDYNMMINSLEMHYQITEPLCGKYSLLLADIAKLPEGQLENYKIPFTQFPRATRISLVVTRFPIPDGLKSHLKITKFYNIISYFCLDTEWGQLLFNERQHEFNGQVTTHQATKFSRTLLSPAGENSPTHLPLMLHIYASVNRVNIGSDNGLSPGWHHAIIWTNAAILLIGPLGTNFSETWIEICVFQSNKWISKYCLWSGRHFVQGEMS